MSRPKAAIDRQQVLIMPTSPLTVRSITARPTVLKLKRPVVIRIATITDWPVVVIDLHTEEGIVGRSYLEPYVVKAMRYLVPALEDLGALLKGRRVAPVELFDAADLTVRRVSDRDYRASIEDPRIDRSKDHLLSDILVIAVCAMLCGAEHFVDFEDFGHSKEDFLRSFLELPHK